jgi:hypothetical protein
MVRGLGRLAALLASLLVSVPAAAQIVGENVNMVSGTQWPGGDPFLQRQNEPTIAVSSVNAQHLMAGANDYRSVDLPNPAFRMVGGDAWLGLFKSLDGGQTWKSVLLPGYPQDSSADGLASPLKATMVVPRTFTWDATKQGQTVSLPAAADPVMRAGTDGMFYYLGINFARDKSVSRLFVARFVDVNNKENGDPTKVDPATGNFGSDPIKYLGTSIVARSTDAAVNGGRQVFIDKPWMAVDVPRAGAATCSVPDGSGGMKSILAGTVYLAWAQFNEGETASDVMFTWSSDCGATFVAPMKINTSNSTLNQGVSLAIEPLTGRVFAAWRRLPAGKQGNAIMATRTAGRKRHFSAPRAVGSVIPFDLGTGYGQARTDTMPSLAISSDGTTSWAHLVWAGRLSDGGQSRIWISNARVYPPPVGDQDDDDPDDFEDETRIPWTKPALASVGKASDDLDHVLTQGHQFMPALATGQGRVVLSFYDTRLDHTRRLYKWSPGKYLGRFYEEELAPLGDRAVPAPDGAPSKIFGNGVPGAAAPADMDDLALNLTRHTIDVRVGMAPAGPSPDFSGVLVTRFPFGLTELEDVYPNASGFAAAGNDPTVKDLSIPVANPITVTDANGATSTRYAVNRLQQLQFNVPGYPMFKGGNAAFIGDYLDVQGQNFVPVAGGWRFNTVASKAPVFHVAWTSNQDVKVPPLKNGAPDWAGYTPVGGRGGTSLFDPTQSVPACVDGYAGSRDQNIYTARITEGLQVFTAQTAKVLLAGTPTSFVIGASNSTGRPITVVFGAPAFDAAYGAGAFRAGYASDFSNLTVPAVVIAPNSSVYRTLFVQQGTAANAAPTFAVTVTESAGCGATGQASCRSGTVTFNPPIALASLVAPDGSTTNFASLGRVETVTPNITNPNITNPNITNPNITNPNITNPNITNPNITNPNITNPNITNPNITNPNITNPNITNPNITNPNITNPNITNTAVSDLTYQVANAGDTAASYFVKIVGEPSAAPKPLQLIISKTYKTPGVDGCSIKEVAHDQVVVNVPDVSGQVVSPTSAVSTGVASGAATNATVALAPGESATITLRGYVPLTEMARVGAALAPAPVPAAVPPFNTVSYKDWASSTGQPPLVKIPTVVTVSQSGADTLASVAVAPGASGAGPITGPLTFIRTRAGVDTILGKVQRELFGLGTPTFTTSPIAGDVITVYYGGDARYAAASSNVQPSTLLATTTTFGYDFAASMGTVTVTSSDAIPNFESANLYVNGVLTFPVQLLNGTNTFTLTLYAGDLVRVEYPGDSTHAASSSAPFMTPRKLLARVQIYAASDGSTTANATVGDNATLGQNIASLTTATVTIAANGGAPVPLSNGGSTSYSGNLGVRAAGTVFHVVVSDGGQALSGDITLPSAPAISSPSDGALVPTRPLLTVAWNWPAGPVYLPSWVNLNAGIGQYVQVAGDTASRTITVPSPFNAGSTSVSLSSTTAVRMAGDAGGFTNLEIQAFGPSKAFTFVASAPTWTARAPMATARLWHCTSGGLEPFIWAAGGTANAATVINSAESYNTVTDAWSPLPPQGITGFGAACSANFNSFGLWGGQAGNSSSTALASYVYVSYDPTWPAPTPLGLGTNLTQAAATWLSNGLVILGGLGNVGTVGLTTVLSPSGLSLPPMTQPRYSHGAAYAGGKLYAIGGLSSMSPISSVEIYDPAVPNIGWASPTYAQLPYPVTNAAVAVVGNSIYVMGGVTAGFAALGSVLVYDTANPTAGWVAGPSLPHVVSYASASSQGGTIYLVGGSGPGPGGWNALGEVWALTP